MSYQAVRTRYDGSVCFLQLYRPQAGNSIDEELIGECRDVLAGCAGTVTAVVLEGLPEVFCSGADFARIHPDAADGQLASAGSGALYDLWMQIAEGPFVSIAVIRGQANAGGVGFVAACDIVLAESAAKFSLSELLFDLVPAMVLPFLIRRIGPQRARYLALTTRPISAHEAQVWGLVDAHADDVERLVRLHLTRLQRLSVKSIRQCKDYMAGMDDFILRNRLRALAVSQRAFEDPDTVSKIERFHRDGRLPWEED
jgi:polyketide biosynthesis enoyl-CoA hydratase PksH